METLGFYNGKWGPLEEMTVPMLDRACYFGDGVYDVTFSENYIPFSLEEHLERFYKSAALLEIKIPYTPEELAGIIRDMMQKLDSGSQWVYCQVTRGTALRDHDYTPEMCGNVWIMLKPMSIRDVYEPISLISLEDTRFLHCNIKTLNLIPSIIATRKAHAAGVYESVLHRAGRVTECAHSNIHILKDGKVKTAPADNLILAGVARAHFLKMCQTLGIPTEETPYTLDELRAADEIIVTSSSALCLRALSLDGEPIGGKDGETLKKLQDALLSEFKEYTKGN